MEKEKIARFNLADKNLKVIGKLFASIREENGLSKYKVYRAAGLSPSQLDSIEDGTKNYTAKSLFAYCKAAGILLPGLDMKLFVTEKPEE